MPQRDTSGLGERVPREIIDADFAVAFSLIEMAEGESRNENGQLASPLIGKAEGMLEDIRLRLLRLTAAQREEFEPRCAELAAAVERAKAPASATEAEPAP